MLEGIFYNFCFPVSYFLLFPVDKCDFILSSDGLCVVLVGNEDAETEDLFGDYLG